MPTAALRICTYPGCINLVRSGRCAVHRQKPDRLFPHDPVSTRLYNSARWKQIRKEHLAKEPFCRECRKHGRQVLGNHVDHIEPHNNDEKKFFAGPFQTLCLSCHTIKTNRERYGTTPGGRKKFEDSKVKADLHLPKENVPDRNH